MMYLGPVDPPPEFGKGESGVFKMPDLKCTSPHDAREYTYSHSIAGTSKCSNPDMWGYNKCPVHCVEKDEDPWIKWAKARESYATTDDDEARPFYLQAMLSQVTKTNPPDAPPTDYGIWMTTESTGRKTRTKTWHDSAGRPHHYEKEVRRMLAIHWVMAALAAWIAVLITGISLIWG